MLEEPENMVVDNLGKRQQALNARVNEAAAKNVSFDEIRNGTENYDIDKLFKIDLAAKYQHVHFIIEVLKCGDSLYITRAINKCKWLFNDQHTNIINPKYLHDQIFKFMSIKMKKKFLTAVSINVRTEQRTENFYHYCMKNDLTHIGFKFLLFTSEEFKKQLLLNHNHPHFKELMKKHTGYVKKVIGNSFSLLEAYLSTLPVEKRYNFVLNLRHMYSINNEKYVKLLEKYALDDENSDTFNIQQYWPKFDLKFSRYIMMRHKDSVLANVNFFVKRIDNGTFTRYITVEDAKILAVAFLPANSSDFWDTFYYGRHMFFLKLIPHEKRYAFLKKIYNDRYPNAEFDMAPGFYSQDYHLLLTEEEREQWAFRNLGCEKCIGNHPIGSDYNWYEFINFKTSFEALQQKIIHTTDLYTRNEMMYVLMRSARNNYELEKVFIYYDKTFHGARQFKDGFLHNIILEKNVFEFDKSCWAAFYKLLLSMELYNTDDLALHNNIYKTVTLLYHILYNIDTNEGLNEFLLLHFNSRMINSSDYGHYNKLNDKQRLVIYDYLFKYYVDKISECKDELFTIMLSSQLKRYFDNITGLMRVFRKDTITKEFVKKAGSHPKKVREIDNSLSDRELLRLLKKDANLVVADDLLNKILIRFKKYPIHIGNFLKKLRIYFPDDIAQIYLKIFMGLISNKLNLKATEAGIFAIFQLADEKTKIDFMDQYASLESSKHQIVQAADIQKAILRFVCYSRPPIPLSSTQKYINKHNMRSFRHLSATYLVNLPFPLCVQLMEIINTQTQHSFRFPKILCEEFIEI